MVRLLRLCLGLQQDAADQDRAVRVFRPDHGYLLVVANAAIAYRLRPRLGAQVPTSPLLERYREMLESRFVWVLVAIGRRRRPLLLGVRLAATYWSTWSGRTRPHSTSLTHGSGSTSASSFSPIRGGGSCCRSSSRYWSSVRSSPPSSTTRWVGCGFSGPTARRKQGDPGSPLDLGRSGRAGEGFQLLV